MPGRDPAAALKKRREVTKNESLTVKDENNSTMPVEDDNSSGDEDSDGHSYDGFADAEEGRKVANKIAK